MIKILSLWRYWVSVPVTVLGMGYAHWAQGSIICRQGLVRAHRKRAVHSGDCLRLARRAWAKRQLLMSKIYRAYVMPA